MTWRWFINWQKPYGKWPGTGYLGTKETQATLALLLIITRESWFTKYYIIINIFVISNSLPNIINSTLLISGRLCEGFDQDVPIMLNITILYLFQNKHNDLYYFYHLINHYFVTTLVVYSIRKNIMYLAMYNNNKHTYKQCFKMHSNTKGLNQLDIWRTKYHSHSGHSHKRCNVGSSD